MIERSRQDRRRAPRETGERRRRGRPPLAVNDPSTDVCVALPASLYDEVYQSHVTHRVSVPEIIRRAIRLAFSSSSRTF
jgi:hypothetical protein